MPIPRIPRRAPTFLVVTLALACFIAAVVLAGCVSSGEGPQGHTTFTSLLTALAAAIVAFLLAPVDAIVALGSALALTLGILAFSPKYPLNPPRTPDGHEAPDKNVPGKPNEKAFQDRSLYEWLFQ